jgi:hypothetical protein
MIYAPRGSHGGLQEGYQMATSNLHFTRPHTRVITMEIPFAFEVEALETNSKYERKKALRRFKIFR